MIDQYAQQFAPPQDSSSQENRAPEPQATTVDEPGAAVSSPTTPTRAQVEAVSCDVARQLGASTAEAISCLSAHLSDARPWLTANGPEDAPIWLTIIRATVAVPRPSGGWERARRIEVAVDATSGRALGFRLVG